MGRNRRIRQTILQTSLTNIANATQIATNGTNITAVTTLNTANFNAINGGTAYPPTADDLDARVTALEP